MWTYLVLLVLCLDGDPLLAVDGLPDADVAGDERVLLPARDEDALVTVGLHHNCLAALMDESFVKLGSFKFKYKVTSAYSPDALWCHLLQSWPVCCKPAVYPHL